MARLHGLAGTASAGNCADERRRAVAGLPPGRRCLHPHATAVEPFAQRERDARLRLSAARYSQTALLSEGRKSHHILRPYRTRRRNGRSNIKEIEAQPRYLGTSRLSRSQSSAPYASAAHATEHAETL